MTHWTFIGEWGMGDFTDLVWARIFSQTSLELEIFSPTYNSVRFFFFQHYTSWATFFSVQATYFPGIYVHAFFLSKSVCRTFLLKSSITPKIHQAFGQLTYSDLSLISKGFWNNGGQNSLGERGGIRFHFPLLGESVRWGHNPIFSDG